MYPKHHAVVSAIVVLAAGLVAGLPAAQLGVWLVAGVLAGVFIDVDHALLVILVDRNLSGILHWVQRPVTALTDPRAFLDDVEYEKPAMCFHRLFTHALILGGIFTVGAAYPALTIVTTPALIAVAIHIASDVAWDVYRGDYLRY